MPKRNLSGQDLNPTTTTQPTKEFTKESFVHLSHNEHARFMRNSNKVGHALILSIDNDPTAFQFDPPTGRRIPTLNAYDIIPDVRPLVNIHETTKTVDYTSVNLNEKIPAYQAMRLEANTPHGTRMRAARYVDVQVSQEGVSHEGRIVFFSPVPEGYPDWWGNQPHYLPLWSDELDEDDLKELEEEISESDGVYKGGQKVEIFTPDVYKREANKNRGKDQNTVMDKQNAVGAYEDALGNHKEQMSYLAEAAFTKMIHAPIVKHVSNREGIEGNYRPEWLHAYGRGLTAVKVDPQKKENLGAYPKWANTEMMVTERLAKWYAMNRPTAHYFMRPLFNMMMNTEVIKDIHYFVRVEENGITLTTHQYINHLIAFPMFRKASDIAQLVMIAQAITNGKAPRDQRGVTLLPQNNWEKVEWKEMDHDLPQPETDSEHDEEDDEVEVKMPTAKKIKMSSLDDDYGRNYTKIQQKKKQEEDDDDIDDEMEEDKVDQQGNLADFIVADDENEDDAKLIKLAGKIAGVVGNPQKALKNQHLFRGNLPDLNQPPVEVKVEKNTVDAGDETEDDIEDEVTPVSTKPTRKRIVIDDEDDEEVANPLFHPQADMDLDKVIPETQDDEDDDFIQASQPRDNHNDFPYIPATQEIPLDFDFSEDEQEEDEDNDLDAEDEDEELENSSQESKDLEILSFPLNMDHLNNAVVKIFKTKLVHDHEYPWKSCEVKDLVGSGSVIDQEKGLILTCSHVASINSAMIQVRLANSTELYEAKILVSEEDCDLAMLQVEHPDFLRKAQQFELGDFASTGSKIAVVGFPVVSNSLTCTTGTISANEIQEYIQGNGYNLLSRIDAPANGGNSGGPVIDQDGKQIGIEFQSFEHDQAERTSMVIPMPVIKQFLTSTFNAISSGTRAKGVPDLPLDTQEMLNPALREHYKMSPKHTGIRIESIDTLAETGGLQVDDIILSVDGHQIQNDGTIQSFPEICERLNYKHLIYQKQIGESVEVQILRDGQEKSLIVPLHYRARELKLIPRSDDSASSTYYVKNGVCFQPVSNEVYESDFVKFDPHLNEKPRTKIDEQLVMINCVFNDAITLGFDNTPSGSIVKSVNGKPINNINDVVMAIETNKSESHQIVLANNQEICIAKASPQDEVRINQKYQVHQSCSDDLSALIALYNRPAAPSVPVSNVVSMSNARQPRKKQTETAQHTAPQFKNQ